MTAGEVIFKFVGDNSNLQKTMDGIGTSVSNMMKVTATGVVAVGGAVSGLIGYGVKFNAEIEQYTTSFTTMLASEEKANNLLANLKKLGAETPFELSDLAKSTQTMLAFGFGVEEAQKYLKVLGDISQGDKQKLDSLTLAFSQMSSSGKLMGQDLLQMINARI